MQQYFIVFFCSTPPPRRDGEEADSEFSEDDERGAHRGDMTRRVPRAGSREAMLSRRDITWLTGYIHVPGFGND